MSRLTVSQRVLNTLNDRGSSSRKRGLTTVDFNFSPLTLEDSCIDPPISRNHLSTRSYAGGRIIRRQSTELTPGPTTRDDFGTDGDDTPHSRIPFYSQPTYLQANASLPSSGDPQTVDLIFLDFIARDVVSALNRNGGTNYSLANVAYYMDRSFTSNSYLPAYARLEWQENVPNCPVGEAVGS